MSPWAALPDFFGRAYGAVAAEAQKQSVQMAGPPFALYRGTPTETVDVEAGLPVTGTIAESGTVVGSCLPATEAVHTGPYGTLEDTYTALQEHMKTAGQTPCRRGLSNLCRHPGGRRCGGPGRSP